MNEGKFLRVVRDLASRSAGPWTAAIRKTAKLKDDQGTAREFVMKVADAESQSITSVGLGRREDRWSWSVEVDRVWRSRPGLGLTDGCWPKADGNGRAATPRRNTRRGGWWQGGGSHVEHLLDRGVCTGQRFYKRYLFSTEERCGWVVAAEV